ncbi:MAG: acetylglutamate kinase [Gemmatimonadales bacterium]
MRDLKVVKVGGNELDRPGWLDGLAGALARAGSPVVVVHGGGQAVDALSRRLGLPIEKRAGRRVTTAAVAEVVEMVLAGPVNRQVVAALRRAGLDAIGLAGTDGGLLEARPVADEDLGHVGEITRVRVGLLDSLLLAGLTPVVAPVAPAGAEGVPLNVNADDAAAAVAGALRATELLFISDVPGLEVEGATQPAVAADEVETIIDLGLAQGGMAAKLRAAARALEAGARAVRIGGPEMLGHAAAGTRLLAITAQPA